MYRAAECYVEALPKAAGPVGEGGIDAFFDRGEPYMNAIQTYWISKDYRRRYPILQLVRSVQPVEMIHAPGVQVADMLAWSMNRGIAHPEDSEDWKRICSLILQAVTRKQVILDEDQFQSVWSRNHRDLISIPFQGAVPHSVVQEKSGASRMVFRPNNLKITTRLR